VNYSKPNEIVHKMIQFLKPRCHGIFLDQGLNGREVVLRNVAENIGLCARRFHAYLLNIGEMGDKWVVDCIGKVILGFVSIVKARSRGVELTLKGAEIEWISYSAFVDVFERKQTRFAGVVEGVRGVLGMAKYNRVRRRLESFI
jgi:telomerase reverse transcriptase